MKKILLKNRLFLIVTGTLVLFYSGVLAQDKRAIETNVSYLKSLAQDISKQEKKDFSVLKKIAKEKGWTLQRRTPNGRFVILVAIDPFGIPIYETSDNAIAAGTTRANSLYTNGGLGLNLNGNTLPSDVVGVWESGGVILGSHQEFAGGRIQIRDGATVVTSHATHVAGTIAASGVYPEARGMAYGLPNLLSFDSNNGNSEMTSYAPSLLLSNHSYGVIAGWRRNESQGNRWEFMGRWGDNEDYKFGYYDSTSQIWDNICFNAPYYLPVKSGGNYRNDNGPAVGQPYWRYNSSGVMVSAGNRPEGISNNDGYGIVGAYGNAKNILTVGAINGLPYGSNSPADIQISSFSAWGPTDDGRIKPDLVADGVNLLSTTNTGDVNYAVSSGTSMAAPNATGTLTLLQELYKQKNGSFMRSATLKGLALTTTNEAGNFPGPDYIYGWGLLNAERAAKVILEDGVKSLISERTLNQGEVQTLQIVASGFGPLVAMICWTDPGIAPVSSASALNNPALRLVNDLDMRMTDGSTTYFPWILDPSNPAAAASTGDNFRDNMEQVYIANATPGKTYTINISHKNSLQNGSQAFSLIVSGVGGSAYCISAPTSSADSKITNFQLANVNYTANNDCKTYSDLTSQTIELEKGNIYTLNLSAGTCGSNQNKIAKVFVDWNGDGDFDDTDELLATTGVMSGNNTYTSTINIPTNVISGNYSRLRIVLMETNQADQVSSCGNYAKGETMDYRILFTESAINAGIIDIVSPKNGDKAENGKKISVRIKNFGTTTLSNIPIQFILKQNGNPVNIINEVLYGELAPKSELEFLLQSTFLAQSGIDYQIGVRTMVANDANPSDDLFEKTVNFAPALSIGEAKAFYTDVNDTYFLDSKLTEGIPFWYDSATATSGFSSSSSLTTTKAPLNTSSYFFSLNNSLQGFGPANKTIYGGGTYTQSSFKVYFKTTTGMVIESARLYIGYPGTVTFDVFDADKGIKVSSSTISVANTRNPASPTNGAANVSTDQGKVYNLNIRFPYAGNFYLTATYGSGATTFRNNGGAGNVNYPITDNLNLFSVVSHTGSTTDMNSFWYYFYGMRVKPIGEEITVRNEVPLTYLTVQAKGDQLTSPIENGNQWYKNGNLIIGANEQNYYATSTGTYRVKVTLDDGITISSQPYELTSLPVILKKFTVRKLASGVRLDWTTAAEQDNLKFVIERSTDGFIFNAIGEVLPNTSFQYGFMDNEPQLGLNYYRIIQLDKNGNQIIFNPQVINFELSNLGNIVVYQNPVKDFFKLKVNALLNPKSLYQVTVINILGQVVKIIDTDAENLKSGLQVNVTMLHKGTYSIRLVEQTSGANIGSVKIIKE